MYFDPRLGVVLHGGFVDSGFPPVVVRDDDTYVWDGNSWSLLPTGDQRPTGSYSSAAYDENLGAGVLADRAPVGEPLTVWALLLAAPDIVPTVPERLLETRASEGQIGYVGAKPSAGQTIALRVTGVGAANVPADAAAVVLNVTITNADGDGYATVWPCDEQRPTASNLNYRAGTTIPNTVISGISADGTVCIYTLAPADILADINGAFTRP